MQAKILLFRKIRISVHVSSQINAQAGFCVVLRIEFLKSENSEKSYDRNIDFFAQTRKFFKVKPALDIQPGAQASKIRFSVGCEIDARLFKIKRCAHFL